MNLHQIPHKSPIHHSYIIHNSSLYPRKSSFKSPQILHAKSSGEIRKFAISSAPRIAPFGAVLAGAGPHAVRRAARGAAAADSRTREAEVAATAEEAPLLHGEQP